MSARINLDKLLPLIKLHGPSYIPIKKAAYYTTLASRIRKQTITIVDKTFDLRIPLLGCLPSGSGKKDLIQFMKENMISSGQREGFIIPTSLHSEQLVGKTLRITPKAGPTRFEKVYGYLYEGHIVLDESLNVLCDPRYEDARKYIRVALDPIGKNEIQKRPTDIPEGEGISYYPHCDVVFMFQDTGWRGEQQLPAALIDEGLLRRMLVLYVSIDEEERLDALNASMVLVDDSEAKQVWVKAMANIDAVNMAVSQNKASWSFQNIGLVFERARALVDQGLEYGGNCRVFSLKAMFDLVAHLARMSIVQAAINGRSTVSDEDVECAFADLRLIWDLTLDFVGVMVQPVKSKGISDREIRALSVLCDLEDRLGGPSILEFQEALGNGGSAQYDYRRLKTKGLIDSRQESSTKTLVWVTERGRAVVD